MAGVVNFLERCLPELGIAPCPVISHCPAYGIRMSSLLNSINPFDNIKCTVRGDTSISKNPFFKGLNAGLNFG